MCQWLCPQIVVYTFVKLHLLHSGCFKVSVSPIVLIDSDFNKCHTDHIYIGSFFLLVCLIVFMSTQVCMSKTERYHLNMLFLYLMKNLTYTRFCSSTANLSYISQVFLVDILEKRCGKSLHFLVKSLVFPFVVMCLSELILSNFTI